MAYQKRQKIIKSYLKEAGSDIGLEKLDGEEIEKDQLVNAITSVPFLAESKLVVVNYPSKNKEIAENIEQVISQLPDTTHLVVYENELDKRSSYYKFISKQKETLYFGELNERELLDWLLSKAKELGVNISPGDGKFLIDRIGPDQWNISNELEKLAGAGAKEINRELITHLTEESPKETIFQLIDCLASSNPQKALQLYGQLRAARLEPVYILAMIGWHLHNLLVVKSANNKNPAIIAKDQKIAPFVVGKSQRVSRTLQLRQLKSSVDLAVNADLRIKTQPNDPDRVLEHLILMLVQKLSRQAV